MDFAFLQAEVNLFLQNLSSSFYPPVLARLEPDSLILSSSPDFLVEAVAQKLGIKGKGSSYLRDAQGRISHIETIMNGREKAHALPSAPCTFFSDSILDLAPLLAATQAVAVRPDRALRHLAQKKGWEIIN